LQQFPAGPPAPQRVSWHEFCASGCPERCDRCLSAKHRRSDETALVILSLWSCQADHLPTPQSVLMPVEGRAGREPIELFCFESCHGCCTMMQPFGHRGPQVPRARKAPIQQTLVFSPSLCAQACHPPRSDQPRSGECPREATPPTTVLRTTIAWPLLHQADRQALARRRP